MPVAAATPSQARRHTGVSAGTVLPEAGLLSCTALEHRMYKLAR
jgi:hypothetical protein